MGGAAGRGWRNGCPRLRRTIARPSPRSDSRRRNGGSPHIRRRDRPRGNALAILDHDRGRMEIVGLAAEQAQLRQRLVARSGLAEHGPVVELEQLIGADQQGIASAGDALRLHLGQHFGRIARLEAGGGKARLGLPLVERGRNRLERDAGRLEHRPPRRAPGGEQQPHARAPSARSVQSLTIASADSSIDRRVTSITGQSLSANRRRAKASSALTASTST